MSFSYCRNRQKKEKNMEEEKSIYERRMDEIKKEIQSSEKL